MRRLLSCVAAAGLLLLPLLALPRDADATLVRKGDGKTVGAASGGVDVGVPKGKVRVQCWQDGRKIIDEADLAVVSLSIASQLNGMRFRRTGDADGTVSVTTQARTACLLGGHE
ncbi:hypothetical protein J2847_002261 [Azospirillum agricola]|uniref:hypothetical protein n=1 Tax=Azospirillum agricola TaxID=1720247 RepID=UPI001AE4EB9F|nr:hypothetical protein [Azospirillum agricola]MBP2228969.1 hypothetical protein [Azospirillum agricola]